MVQQFQFFTQRYTHTVKPGFKPEKWAEELLSFYTDFENKVNEQLKQGWKVLNVDHFPWPSGKILQAYLVKEG